MSAWKEKEIIKSGFRYVSDGLESEIQHWKHITPILIEAPTGSGKNTFVRDTLRSKVKKRYASILLLTNRTALTAQEKQKLIERGYHIAMADLQECEEFDNICIISYQKILSYLQNPYHRIHQINFEYIIFDEVHFFLSDAKFNSETSLILASVINAYPNKIRIYMSATPNQVKPIIHQYEYGVFYSYRQKGDNFLYDVSCTGPTLYHYKFDFDYSDCKFHFCNEWPILISYIASTPKEEKWLIFVKSISDGEMIKDLLDKKGITKDEITAIDSGKKDDPTYKSIIKRESFKTRILITTSVIDNGINLTQSSLKHIVIQTWDSVSAVQMAGRKRRTDGEMLNLYFVAFQQKQLQSALQKNQKLQKIIRQDTQGQFQRFLTSAWGDLPVDAQKLFRVLPTLAKTGQKSYRFELNPLAEVKLKIDHGMLEFLMEMESEDEFPIEVLRWFHNPVEYSPDMRLEVSPSRRDACTAELTTWLEDMVKGQPITKKHALEARKKLAELYKDVLCSEMKILKKEDTDYLVTDINNALEKLFAPAMCPYVFRKVKKAENGSRGLSPEEFYWELCKSEFE